MRQDKRPICQDGASHLRQAILELAIRDYLCALKCRANGTQARHSVKRLEEFFLSEYGQFLSDGHGKDIINRCRKEVPIQSIQVEITCSEGFSDRERQHLLGEITGWLMQKYPGSFIVKGGDQCGD